MIIYCTTNKLNGKKYIGSDTKNRTLIQYPGSGKLLKLAIQKYGIENFEKVIVEECKSENIKEKEIYWLNFFKTAESDLFYNIVDNYLGGRNSKTFTKGHAPTKGCFKKGAPSWNKNKKYTKEQYEKIIKGQEKRAITMRIKIDSMTELERKLCFSRNIKRS